MMKVLKGKQIVENPRNDGIDIWIENPETRSRIYMKVGRGFAEELGQEFCPEAFEPGKKVNYSAIAQKLQHRKIELVVE